MRKKTRLAFIVIVIAVVAGSLSWVLIKKNKTKEDCNTDTSGSGECKVDLGKVSPDSKSSSSSATAALSVSPTATKSSYLYRNEQYKFELTFNAAWDGYSVKERSEQGAQAIYDFLVATKDKNYANSLATPLTVKIYLKDNYPANTNSTKIKEDDKYVYAYSIWEQNPSDTAITEKDISKVISTFKLY